MILEQCKGVHRADLGESFQTHIYLQILASIFFYGTSAATSMWQKSTGATAQDYLESQISDRLDFIRKRKDTRICMKGIL